MPGATCRLRFSGLALKGRECGEASTNQGFFQSRWQLLLRQISRVLVVLSAKAQPLIMSLLTIVPEVVIMVPPSMEMAIEICPYRHKCRDESNFRRLYRF